MKTLTVQQLNNARLKIVNGDGATIHPGATLSVTHGEEDEEYEVIFYYGLSGPKPRFVSRLGEAEAHHWLTSEHYYLRQSAIDVFCKIILWPADNNLYLMVRD